MHERERHRIILSAVQEKSVVTIQDIAELTEASKRRSAGISRHCMCRGRSGGCGGRRKPFIRPNSAISQVGRSRCPNRSISTKSEQ